MSIEAHKHLVKQVMEGLRGSMAHTGLGEEELMVAPAAINIVASIMECDNWLIVGREVHRVGSVKQVPTPSGPSWEGCKILEVQVPDDGGPHCAWCRNPYGTAETGAPYGLCRNCWQYGPSENAE